MAQDTCVVLLHEDYPHELPVFGQTNVDNKFRHVIFVLGTVRDMTVNEQVSNRTFGSCFLTVC